MENVIEKKITPEGASFTKILDKKKTYNGLFTRVLFLGYSYYNSTVKTKEKVSMPTINCLSVKR